mmetsp:Transcript_50578/g.122061  ORF Transcript_50578/g.122061 Transcript_50578/m.122061 type:complete len:452 (+) Transcript_50578:47-1402(+)
MRIISLQIPEGAEPGDSLSFSVDGQDLEIPIPVGSQAGEILEIQVGGEDDGGNNGHEDNDVAQNLEQNADEEKQNQSSTVVKIPCLSGVIELVSGTDTSTSTRVTDTMEYGDNNATKSDDDYYRIYDGTYVHPWPSGTAMADFFRNEDSNDWLKRLFSKTSSPSPSAAPASTISSSTTTDGISVLELGSGMGMVGLAFAANYITKSESLFLPSLKQMVLSDVDAGLSLLRTNIERNRDILPKDSSTVTAQALQWSTDSSDKAGTFDVILASDVLYNSECIPALVATIKRHLNTNQSSSSVLVAVRWRKPDLERQFFKELEGWNNKTWKRVHTMNCPLSWREYGLPTSDVSNKYFHQTMVSVNGNPKSLAEILDAENPSTSNNDTTNDDAATKIPTSLMDGMNDEEAEAFESFFIQVYCLCDKDIEDPADTNKRSREECDANEGETKKVCKD